MPSMWELGIPPDHFPSPIYEENKFAYHSRPGLNQVTKMQSKTLDKLRIRQNQITGGWLTPFVNFGHWSHVHWRSITRAMIFTLRPQNLMETEFEIHVDSLRLIHPSLFWIPSKMYQLAQFSPHDYGGAKMGI